MEQHEELESFSETIRLNFQKLVETTVCSDKLLNMCWSAGVLTEEERQNIISSVTQLDKSSEFYLTIRIKGRSALIQAVEVLRVHNSSQVPYQILRGIIKDDGQSSSPSFRSDSDACTSTPSCSGSNQIRNICADVLALHPKLPVKSFFGREHELDEIHRILTNSFAKDDVHILCITGLGGIGKSELARAYAQKYRQFYNGNCIWINSDCMSSIQESFLAIAGDLGISIQSSQGRPRLLHGIVADIYRLLSPVQCLVIFDNVEEFQGPNGISTSLPNLPPELNAPWILMTSRVTNWALVDSFLVVEMPLQVPSLEDSTKFLQQQLGLSTEDELKLAEKLCAELECLPLGLQQASAYISTDIRRMTSSDSRSTFKLDLLRKYLQRSKEREQVLADGRYQKMSDRYQNTIMNTWSLTMKKIQQDEQDEHAILWLKTIAYRRPFDIPVSKFIRDTLEYDDHEECSRIIANVFKLSLQDQDEESVHQSLNLLADYSMIRLEQGLISLHRLVAQVLIFQLRGEKREGGRENKEESVLRLILSPLPSLSTSEFDKRRVEICKYWQHCLPYDDLIKRFASGIGIRVNQDGIFNFPLDDTVKRFEQVLGADHEDTLTAKLISITQYGHSGYKEKLSDLLQSCEQKFGSEHKLTARFRVAVVNDHVKMERYKEALQFGFLRNDLNVFRHTNDLVLHEISKKESERSAKRLSRNTLDEISSLYSAAWNSAGDKVDDESDEFIWICFRGLIILTFLQGKQTDALNLLNTNFERFKSRNQLKFVVSNYAEIMSFLEKSDNDMLFNNLLQFWNISEPGASKRKQYADWWVQLKDEISIQQDKYLQLNESFGNKVAIKESYSNFVPHGFVLPIEDFQQIDTCLTRYTKTMNYMLAIAIRDLDVEKQLKKLPPDDKFMETIQAFLGTNVNHLVTNLEYASAILAIYNSREIVEWHGGEFLIYLGELIRRNFVTCSQTSTATVAVAGKGLQLLHTLIQEGQLKSNVPNSLVKTLLWLCGQTEDVSICSKIYSILITLTDDTEERVLQEEDVDELLIMLEKYNIKAVEENSKPQELRKYLTWIFANLAESGVLSSYKCATSILESFASILKCMKENEEDGHDHDGLQLQIGLETFLIHSIIIYTLCGSDNEDMTSSDCCLNVNSTANLKSVMEANVEIWVHQRSVGIISSSELFRVVNYNNLRPLIRLASSDKSLYQQFSISTLAGLLEFNRERYAPLILQSWPDWYQRLNELSISSENIKSLTTIILEIMLSVYSVPVLQANSQAS